MTRNRPANYRQPAARSASAATALLLVAGAFGGLDAQEPDLDEVREALSKYEDPIVAIRDGYLSTLGCVVVPETAGEGHVDYPAGAMGIHFLNPEMMGAELDPLRPQILLYEPAGDGLRLVGAEWFVPVELAEERPELFGRPFDGPMEGHEPLMPEELHHWDLHVWLWRDNPEGTFAPTNPAVECPEDHPHTLELHAPRLVDRP